MRIVSRRRTTIFFLALGVSLAAIAVAVGSGWILLNWRFDVKVVLGVIFFGAITAGIILNTTFLLREIRRNEQHDSFINAVTHELKTPITSTRLYLQTLQHRDVGEAQRREFYRLMLDDCDRLLTTVEQVLKAGEAGHKRGPRHLAPVDFGQLVGECIEIARARYHLQSGSIRYDQTLDHSGKAGVNGDPEELRTAVANVLDNAVKYSGGRVNIRVRLDALDERHIALTVQDSGIGIPDADLKRVFKRFYRASNHSAKVNGTGLGLFIVRSIARKHGGRAFAESEGEGRGTTVTLELPRSPV